MSTVVLVEGVSDRVALHTLAERRGRDLDAEGVMIVEMGGATNLARHLERFGPGGAGVRLAGLCDAAEEIAFRAVLARAGFAVGTSRAEMEALGFYVCVEDLEDELIRALGATAVEHLIAAQGELRSFRTMQKQPAQRSRPVDQQLRRFFGSHSGAKIRYARLLVGALDLSGVPRPLDGVLAHV